MTDYRFALNHDNTAGLTVVSIQPSSPGIKVTLVRDGNGLARIKGKGRTQWRYEPSITAEEWTALQAEVGALNYFDTPGVECTIRTALNDDNDGMDRAFGDFNAWISLPAEPRYKWFWDAPYFDLLIDLEQL